jgi:hypothetical protein
MQWKEVMSVALNPQNLTSLGDRPEEERRAIAAKGGHARKAMLDKRKNLRLALEELLGADHNVNGEVKSGAEAISVKLFEKALNGDVKAFETIRATVGQDPVQKVMVADVDQATIEEVEAAVMGSDTTASD